MLEIASLSSLCEDCAGISALRNLGPNTKALKGWNPGQNPKPGLLEFLSVLGGQQEEQEYLRQKLQEEQRRFWASYAGSA